MRSYRDGQNSCWPRMSMFGGVLCLFRLLDGMRDYKSHFSPLAALRIDSSLESNTSF